LLLLLLFCNVEWLGAENKEEKLSDCEWRRNRLYNDFCQ